MSDQSTSRRDFLKTTTAAAVGTGIAGWGVIPGAYAQGSDEIRIGLIGAGGRGTGAVADVFKGHEQGGIRLVAIGDVFADRVEASRTRLAEQHGAAAQVANDHVFSGFDAYQKVIASDVNYIILATPPGFRPQHLEAAIDAGKNVFTEKPLAVDGPGIRKVMALADKATAKGLCVIGGTQRRHQHGYIDTMKRIHDGAIGDVVAARCYWNQGFLWKRDRQAEWTDMEWQLRNWLYFTWLSGDHIVEQHIHNIDVINWIKGGYPVRAQGMGGRQVRNKKIHGQIFDHHFVEFAYADGSRLYSQCRQGQVGAYSQVTEHVTGTKGSANLGVQNHLFQIIGANPWEVRLKAAEDGHQLEHYPLIEAIRNNQPMNEGEHAAMSTMTAILGRMATYSGKQVEWDDAIQSKLDLMPQTFAWDAAPPVLPNADGFYPVALPGQTVAL